MTKNTTASYVSGYRDCRGCREHSVNLALEFCNFLFSVSKITDNVTADHVKNASVLSRVQKGGIYKPRDCKPIDSVAIIIPYRDREKHLAIFINYMHVFLQRQQLQYGIFVAELVRYSFESFVF